MLRIVMGIGLLLALSAPAAADLLRCKNAEGKTIYTDKPELCPGAEPFEPKGEIQTPVRCVYARRSHHAVESPRARPKASASGGRPGGRSASLEAEEARQRAGAREDPGTS